MVDSWTSLKLECSSVYAQVLPSFVNLLLSSFFFVNIFFFYLRIALQNQCKYYFIVVKVTKLLLLLPSAFFKICTFCFSWWAILLFFLNKRFWIFFECWISFLPAWEIQKFAIRCLFYEVRSYKLIPEYALLIYLALAKYFVLF